jgi:hypothetical protein
MRVAALYDVHGNLPALTAVLAEMDESGVDAIVVGGWATEAILASDWATDSAYLQALLETGATGLEPATSGVTGHFQGRDMNDGGHAIALLMRFLDFAPHLTRMVERNKIGRLLPDCCPNLPQAVRCHERRSLDLTGAPVRRQSSCPRSRV